MNSRLVLMDLVQHSDWSGDYRYFELYIKMPKKFYVFITTKLISVGRIGFDDCVTLQLLSVDQIKEFLWNKHLCWRREKLSTKILERSVKKNLN